MSKKVFRFEKVDIKKMPGLNRGLKAYENLSPHINIIAGPNASGKSSTARAIQQIMSQVKDGQTLAEAAFNIDDESWISHIDFAYIKTQKNGIDTELKGIKMDGEHSRYMLSLHELIKKDDKHLAEKILKDAIGGYDIDATKTKLGYSDSKRNKSVAEFKEYENARKSVYEITNQQKELQTEQNKLEKLSEQKAKAVEANEFVKFYKLVEEYKNRQAALKVLEDELSAFPEKIAKVKEEDYENLDTFLRENQEKKTSLENTKVEMSRLETEITQLNLPEEGVDSQDVKYAANVLDELKEFESKIHEAEDEIARADSELKTLSGKLGLDARETTFDGLDLAGIDLTDKYWQTAFDLFGEISRLEQLIKQLNEEKKDIATKSETLKDGITALSRWLGTTGDSGKPISLGYLAFILISSILTAIAVHFFDGIGYAGLILVATFLYLLHKNQSTPDESNISVRKGDFEETGLTAPTSWGVEEVAKRIIELINELEETRQLESISEKITEHERHLKEKKENFEAFRNEAQKTKEALKIIPSLDSESLKKYSALYWYLKDMINWQGTKSKIDAETAVVRKNRDNIETLLTNLNPIFNKYGIDPVASYAKAKAEKDQLEEYRERYNELVRNLEAAKSTKERTEKELERTGANAKSICDRLGITSEEVDLVRELVGKLGEFQRKNEQKSTASAFLKESQNSLTSHHLHVELGNEIVEITSEELFQKITKYEADAAELESISKSITEIETLVRSTEQKHELENALQHQEKALQDLEGVYKLNAYSIIGELLTQQVKEHLGEVNMPGVFVRAKELFRRITKNRYELVVDSSKGDANFSAKDLRDGVGRTLDELSTGTRIQLIMSVRLAFIEQAEDEISLPILADELLANSDTHRANAIIDALIEISKAGRQVFYFTAQEDEVAKWEIKLKNEKDIEHKVYIIEQGDRHYELELNKEEVFAGIQLQKEIQSPAAMSYEAYGKTLGVPSLPSIFTPVEQLHIWYLFDDAELLYTVIKKGIENWGMLKSYFKEGGIFEGMDKTTQHEIEQKAELLAQYLEWKQHGNNRPVDRQVLEESGAVSDTFIEPTTAKLEEYGFDPGALIKAIEAREVPGFRDNKKEELEEYFISEGYIQEAEPFSAEEIQTKLLAYISNANISTKKAEQLLERLGRFG